MNEGMIKTYTYILNSFLSDPTATTTRNFVAPDHSNKLDKNTIS